MKTLTTVLLGKLSLICMSLTLLCGTASAGVFLEMLVDEFKGHTPWEQLKTAKNPIDKSTLQNNLLKLASDPDWKVRAQAAIDLRFSQVDHTSVLRTIAQLLPQESKPSIQSDMIYMLGARQPKDPAIADTLAAFLTDPELNSGALWALSRIQAVHTPDSSRPEDNFTGYTLDKLVAVLRNRSMDEVGARLLLTSMYRQPHLVEYELFCDSSGCNQAPSTLPHTQEQYKQQDESYKKTPVVQDEAIVDDEFNEVIQESMLIKNRINRHFGSPQ